MTQVKNSDGKCLGTDKCGSRLSGKCGFSSGQYRRRSKAEREISRLLIRPWDRLQIARGTVAQISNLLFRRFSTCWSSGQSRRAWNRRTLCRLQIGDTADWKSALRACVAYPTAQAVSFRSGSNAQSFHARSQQIPFSPDFVLKICPATPFQVRLLASGSPTAT